MGRSQQESLEDLPREVHSFEGSMSLTYFRETMKISELGRRQEMELETEAGLDYRMPLGKVFDLFSSTGSSSFLLIDSSFSSTALNFGLPHGPGCRLLIFSHPSRLSPQGISSSPLTLNTIHMPMMPDFIPIEQAYSMPPLQCLTGNSNLTHKLKSLIFPVPQVCFTHSLPSLEKDDSTCPVSWAQIPGVFLDGPAPRHAVCQPTWMVLPSDYVTRPITRHHPHSHP